MSVAITPEQQQSFEFLEDYGNPRSAANLRLREEVKKVESFLIELCEYSPYLLPYYYRIRNGELQRKYSDGPNFPAQFLSVNYSLDVAKVVATDVANGLIKSVILEKEKYASS